jgi:hypothetical protein
MSYSTSKVYARLPLDPAKKECRIFYLLPADDGEPLCGELQVKDFDEIADQYTCLSYVWGDATVRTPSFMERKFKLQRI